MSSAPGVAGDSPPSTEGEMEGGENGPAVRRRITQGFRGTPCICRTVIVTYTCIYELLVNIRVCLCVVTETSIINIQFFSLAAITVALRLFFPVGGNVGFLSF